MILALVALCSTAFASAESPTDDEVIAAYTNANKVYNWFGINPLPTNGRQKKEIGFMIYYNVNFPNVRTMIFLILSGIATGLSWLCYFKAIQIGEVAKVVPIDKFSIVLTLILAFVVLGEPVTNKAVIGGILITIGTFVMIL